MIKGESASRGQEDKPIGNVVPCSSLLADEQLFGRGNILLLLIVRGISPRALRALNRLACMFSRPEMA